MTDGWLMDCREAADYLRLHPSTVYRMLKNCQLPAAKIGGRWRFRREWLDDFLEKKKRRIKNESVGVS